jgi:hypothetical protein
MKALSLSPFGAICSNLDDTLGDRFAIKGRRMVGNHFTAAQFTISAVIGVGRRGKVLALS